MAALVDTNILVYRFGVLYSEDFQHERLYGSVQAIDPFAG